MRSLTVLVIAGLDLAIHAALLSEETFRGCPGKPGHDHVMGQPEYET